MKIRTRRSSCVAISLFISCGLVGQQSDAIPGRALEPDDPVAIETKLVAEVRGAVQRGDDVAIGQGLARVGEGDMKGRAMSVLVARRVAAVCGWLCNDNDYRRAMILARQTIKQLGTLKETNDADRADRLYWEAWLHSEILDEKVKAIALLKAAEKLAPEDERITDLQLRLVAAVAEFGR